MTTLTVAEARRTLYPLVKQVADDRVPVEIASESGNVVIMAAEDFEAWQETAYLLASPANAERLRRSYQDAVAGRTVEHALDLS
ncbi:MAG: type II toxin-antitoxin system prevent-host-death family antitoxin [Propionibacteriaceae bacterium]|jgi:antitoxin YefM|nr:type II toxin-antitoxin system prevent-host-death family antitoxin [Propionibacteriaceae bacterium]